MTVEVFLKGASGPSTAASVSRNGEVLIRRYTYDEAVYKEIGTDNTAVNFYGPKAGFQFVITGVVLKADAQVSTTTDAAVVIYEASTATTTTADKVLFQTAMLKSDQVAVTGMQLLVNKGKYVNGKTSDDDIHATILGYYVPTED